MGDDETRDQLAAISIGAGLIGPIAAWALGWWEIAGAWLVDHHVLVGPDADPLWSMPGFGGAGVDVIRVVVAVAAIVAVVAAAVMLVGRGRGER